MTSSGRSCTGVSDASGATGSGSPLSWIRKSLDRVVTPAGSITRWQILPKISMYWERRVFGRTVSISGDCKSPRRLVWTLSVSTANVSLAHS